jgi:hypothetical protein
MPTIQRAATSESSNITSALKSPLSDASVSESDIAKPFKVPLMDSPPRKFVLPFFSKGVKEEQELSTPAASTSALVAESDGQPDFTPSANANSVRRGSIKKKTKKAPKRKLKPDDTTDSELPHHSPPKGFLRKSSRLTRAFQSMPDISIVSSALPASKSDNLLSSPQYAQHQQAEITELTEGGNEGDDDDEGDHSSSATSSSTSDEESEILDGGFGSYPEGFDNVGGASAALLSVRPKKFRLFSKNASATLGEVEDLLHATFKHDYRVERGMRMKALQLITRWENDIELPRTQNFVKDCKVMEMAQRMNDYCMCTYGSFLLQFFGYGSFIG